MDILLTGVAVFWVAYLIGSFPTAYLLGRIVKGVDIRRVGSRNAGAVNAFREVAPWAGLTALAVDGVKGAVVILAVQALGLGDYAMFVGALAVVAGHNWPVFLGFRGGKGVATVLGLSMAVLPVWALVALALSLASGFATRSVVFGIAVGIVAINAFTIATGQDASPGQPMPYAVGPGRWHPLRYDLQGCAGIGTEEGALGPVRNGVAGFAIVMAGRRGNERVSRSREGRSASGADRENCEAGWYPWHGPRPLWAWRWPLAR